MSWLKHLVAGLLTAGSQKSRPHHVGFTVNKVTLGAVFLRVPPPLLISTILSILNTLFFIYIAHHKYKLVNSKEFQNPMLFRISWRTGQRSTVTVREYNR